MRDEYRVPASREVRLWVYGHNQERNMKRQLAVVSVLAASVTLVIQGCGGASAANSDPLAQNRKSSEYYLDNGQTRISEEEARVAIASGKAKNVILFVGDGMGVSTVTAARIFDGQMQSKDGESNSLYMEKFPYLAMSKTYSVNQQTADSAPTMTAMVTGVKTKESFLSTVGTIKKNDAAGCAETNRLGTIGELAEVAGMSTGVVSTARITHATPAAVYAHTPNRDAESDKDQNDLIAAGALAATGCTDIAKQLVNFGSGQNGSVLFGDGSGLEVALGGGRRAFLPSSVTDVEGTKGRRTAGDLTADWLTRYAATNGSVVNTRAQLNALDATKVDHVLGLFNASHMDYDTDRVVDVTGNKDEPSLAEMTEAAIKVLRKNPKGYFLMVEGGRIDHAHHAGNAYRALNDVRAFNTAIQKADDLTSDDDTLIVVTADHSHTLTLGGYPFRNNPILGLTTEASSDTGDKSAAPAVDMLGLPYTTLMYANGLGHGENVPAETNPKSDKTATTPGSLKNPRADLTGKDAAVQDKNYHQEALVAMASETHAGEDVMIFAKGPGAHLFRGVVEQSYIYHVMTNASALLKGLSK